jgi:SIR2-like domain
MNTSGSIAQYITALRSKGQITMMQPASNILLDDLKEQIARGQVVAIIGAGVSIGATNRAECAAWTGLLHHGVQRCEHLQLITPKMAQVLCQQIDSGDLDFLLAAAETIAAKLGAPKGGEYRRWLRESVGTLRAERRKALEALRDLHVALATTNYDDLLEEVTGLPPVTWMDGARVERVLRGDEPGVLHLHGYWGTPESVILGIRSYEQVLGNEPAQNIQRTLATVKTLLFVGCGEGLHDPNFGKLIEWTGRVFAQSEYRRYRLALESEREELQKQHPPEQRLFVISYGQQHSDLAPFLRSLGIYRPNATSTLTRCRRYARRCHIARQTALLRARGRNRGTRQESACAASGADADSWCARHW